MERYFPVFVLSLLLHLSVSGVFGQPPSMNMTNTDVSPVCETLTVSMCLQRDVGYDQTIYPNLAGMFSQSDAEDAMQSFGQLVQFGCTTMADFLCYLFAPPCLEAGGVSVPVPPCREVCDQARSECEPMLKIAQVPWPEQFDCSRFPAASADGPVRCAESEMRVYSAIEEADNQEGGEEVMPEQSACQEISVPECAQLGYTHTTFPNLFGHTSPVEMAQDMGALQGLVLSGCSADVLPLICGAYMPKCDPATGEAIMPCKETCRRISKECKDSVKALNLGRVDLFSCRQYPSRKDDTCIEDLRAPAPPMIMNTTRPTVSQVKLFIQQPEIAGVSVDGLEVKYYNVLGDDEGMVFIQDAENMAMIDTFMTPSSYVVMVRSVNAWGKSEFVDAVIPEFTGYEHCEPLTIPLCRDFTYDMVQYPNLLQQATQADASSEAVQFIPLIGTQCSPDLQPFLCSLYAPPCTGLPSPQGIKPPCRELCKSARIGCEPLMNKFGFQWPDTMDCEMFPSVEDVGRSCFNNEGLIVNPTTGDGRGSVETEFGSMAMAHCSSDSDGRPMWLNPEGDPVPMKSEGAMVYAEDLGTDTTVLTVTSLSSDNAGTYNCRLGSEMQPMNIDTPKTCVAAESNLCRAEDGSSWMSVYPNLLGHPTPTEADLASYQFLPLMATGCAPVNLPLFVCSLYHPPCNIASLVVPPCMELCETAMTECSLFIMGSQWAWPAHAQCSNFPSMNDMGVVCLAPIVASTEPAPTTESPTTTTQVTTTASPEPEPEAESEPEPTASGTDGSNMARDGNSGPLLSRSYSISQRGMMQFYRGWVDVQGQGAPNDFCRIVKTDGRPFFSCLLAGSEGDDLLSYTSPDPSVEWFDPGYSNTWYMRDEDGDGRDDYCRCTGSLPSSTVMCMKAGPTGFLSAEDDFVPENAPADCLFRMADPFFGFY